MSRDSSYKGADDIIVTVPMSKELHRRMRVKAIHDNLTIKALVTKLIAEHCP